MRRNNTPWYVNTPVRLRFERGARELCPALVAPKPGRSGDSVVYQAKISVPYYDVTRSVVIVFARTREIAAPQITVDGPDTSPHRYDGGLLCIWEPTDPPEERWVPSDGLAELIRMITEHLFKEEWWRENGEWLGPQLLHRADVKGMPDG